MFRVLGENIDRIRQMCGFMFNVSNASQVVCLKCWRLLNTPGPEGTIGPSSTNHDVIATEKRKYLTGICLVCRNLSIADLLVVAVCVPTAMVDVFSEEIWYLGSEMCKYYWVDQSYSPTNISRTNDEMTSESMSALQPIFKDTQINRSCWVWPDQAKDSSWTGN